MNPSLQSPVSSLQSNSDVLVRVEGVSKKFCLSLKKSLWYGLQDMGRELTGRRRGGVDGRRQTVDGRLETRDGRLETAAESLQSTVRSPQSNSLGLRPKEFWAVNNVSFELKRGECLGLIGRNGAGKTTLLKMLNGLIKPDAGRIEMRGRVGALIALGAGFNPILTGRENIYVNGSVLGLSKKEIGAKLNEIIDFAEIGDFIDTPVQSYSSGMTVRLGFAVASALDPDIMLLDEVLAVGDVSFQAKCLNRLAELRSRGAAFILVSHNMHQISRFSDRVLYLKNGQVSHCGDREDGIERFLSDMDQAGASAVKDGTDWTRVHGSGKVVFTGARFRNANNEVVTAIDAGDPVTLEIDYQCPGPLDELPGLDVVILDRGGVVFQGTNIANRYPLDIRPSSGRIIVQIASLPVNGDYVEFFFTMFKQSTAEVYDWKRHMRLDINRCNGQRGRVLLSVSWVAKESC